MSARPQNLNTVRLSLELLRRIPRNRKVTAAELHEQLTQDGWQRDVRTIQRQLDELSQAFDIERDMRSKPYGYSWKSNARALSLPGLDEKEALLLTLAEEHLRHLLPVGVTRSLTPFFEQARSTLGTSRTWLRKVRVVDTSQPLLPPAVKPGVFDAVSTALFRDEWLEVDYRNASGRRVTSSVMPLGLAQQGPRLYLVCRFRDHDDERSLALHRMLEVRLSGLPFERPDFDLQAYDEDGHFAFGDGQRIKLVFRIAQAEGRHLLETPLSRDQKVRQVSGGYEVRATVVRSEHLKWWLRGFGNRVTVVSPRTLLRQAPAD